MRVLVIRHESWKILLLRAASRRKHRNLGAFDGVLREAGIPFDYHEIAIDQPLEAPVSDYTHVIVLGGNVGAYEEEKHAFLRTEMQILEQALALDLPVLGICLGAQLLARVLGGKVFPGPCGLERGWSDLALTDEGRADPLFGNFPAASKVFQWHGDTFELPPGAVHLARSRRYENQAFRWGQRVYALQFHLEADEPIIHSWLRDNGRSLDDAALDLEAVRAATVLHLPESLERSRAFIRAFMGA